MGRALRALASIAVATASSFLAYLLAEALILHAPILLLAALSGIEVVGFQPQPRIPCFLPAALTRWPPDAPAWLYALQLGSYLPAALLLMVAVTLAGQRASGWLRVTATQAVLWATFFLTFYSGAFSGGRFRLQRALEVLWPTFAHSEGQVLFLGGALIGVSLFAAWVCLRGLLDRAPTRAGAWLGWLLLPALLVGALLITLLYNWRLLGRSGPAMFFLAWIAAPIVVAGLPAALWRPRRAPALELHTRSAVAMAVAATVALGALAARGDILSFLARRDLNPRSTRHWQLLLDAGAATHAETAVAAYDERAVRIGALLGTPLDESPLRACLFSSTQAKVALTGTDEPVTLNARRMEINHLLTPAGDISDARGDALLLMRRAWSEPGSPAVALALARYGVGDFFGQPLRDYAGQIAREETAYTLRDVFALDTEYLSPLVRDALSGAWVARIVERRGKSVLPVLYRTPLEAGKVDEFARAVGMEWDELEQDWRNFLLGLAATPSPTAEPRSTPFFHRGISFSHEVGGGWGYGSDRAGDELLKIRALGANSVAIVPYAFTRAPEEVHFNFATDESDARVVRAIEQARHAGLHVMLKPQLWSRGFTGNIAFENRNDFERWFALYRRWLLHYARMSELHGVDLLVVGTELGGVTPHEAVWRGLIRDLRRIYHGPLTYAAHWDREVEAVGFWDALDYIGVNFYFPLADAGEAPSPDSPRVRAITARLGELAARYRKPVILTEVGYPATATAAAQPWVESGRVDNTLQQRCYRVVFEAFYDQPWLAGLYWWKWPSHGLGSPAAPTFVPLDKPALEAVRKWYHRPEAPSALP
ncbi:MAG TPA: hypothetical protein VNN18_11470 [Candidatus Xenobia bacterium]|nr:hypothetical protein [Candidatus Xenobia bacterium]